MQLSPLSSRPVQASDIPMESLSGNTHLTKEEKLGEVSRQFEAIMLREILQNAQKSALGPKSSGDTATGAIYQDMVTSQMADGISKSGAFGFAQQLKKQLNQELHLKTQETK